MLEQSCFVEQPTGLFKSCGTVRDTPSRPSELLRLDCKEAYGAL